MTTVRSGSLPPKASCQSRASAVTPGQHQFLLRRQLAVAEAFLPARPARFVLHPCYWPIPESEDAVRIAHIRENAAAIARETGVPVIADVKRGDIAKTGEMYAKAHFTGDFEANFVTLAPYMGLDSIHPYLPYAEKQGKGMFVLCRTSNPGAKDFEYEALADGRHVYDLVGDKVTALGADYMGQHGYSSIGLVIGGTHAEEASEIRARYKNSFFLIPGYGAQGGKASDIALYLNDRNGGVVNSSRGILLAWKKQPGTAFDEAAYNECVRMKEDIAHACDLL